MAKYLIAFLIGAGISDVMGTCTFTFTKNHGHISCTNVTSEDYLGNIFKIKSDIVNSMSKEKVAKISINIENSYVPRIEDWLFLPWDEQFSVQSVKIVNSSVNSVKPLSKLMTVETLDLSRNDIFDYRFLNKMKKLRNLHLSHSRFSSDSYLFTYLQREQTRLQLISLSNCSLKYFGVITNLIDNYDLSFNPNLTLIEFNHSIGYRSPLLKFSGINNSNDLVLKHRRTVECLCLSLDLSNYEGSLDFLSLNNICISEMLLLNNNNIPSLNETAFKLRKLISKKCLGRMSIDVSSSNLTNISSNFFRDHTLNVLNLSTNNLISLNGSIFSESNILYLDVSNSNISSISPSVFNYLTVNTLNMSRNNISSLDGVFDYVESIEHLDISFNPIEALNKEIFKNCHNLEVLNLGNVFIKTLSENTFLHLSSLKVLILSFKDVMYSESIKSIHVTDLTLTNTTLTRLEAEQFKGFYKLQRLTFVDSSVSAIDSSALKGLFNLKKINNLKKIGNYDLNIFEQLYSFEHLDLSHHKLIKLNLELKDLQSLRKLNLSSNAISSIDVNSFITLKQLEVLSLADNALSVIAVGTFRELAKLTHLYLNKNQLQQLVPGIFSGLDNLFLLDLSQNDLLRTKPHLILGMSVPKLTYLYLQDNGMGNEYAKGDDMLRRNEFNIIANHNKLKYVDINKNGWRCPTLVDVLTLLKNKNISYNPTNPELVTANINGVSCT